MLPPLTPPLSLYFFRMKKKREGGGGEEERGCFAGEGRAERF